jgi:hypothetical protein
VGEGDLARRGGELAEATERVGGEVVSRAEELLEPFVLTLERHQTQQT